MPPGCQPPGCGADSLPPALPASKFETSLPGTSKAPLACQCLHRRPFLLRVEAYSEAVTAGKGQALAEALASADASAAQEVRIRLEPS